VNVLVFLSFERKTSLALLKALFNYHLIFFAFLRLLARTDFFALCFHSSASAHYLPEPVCWGGSLAKGFHTFFTHHILFNVFPWLQLPLIGWWLLNLFLAQFSLLQSRLLYLTMCKIGIKISLKFNQIKTWMHNLTLNLPAIFFNIVKGGDIFIIAYAKSLGVKFSHIYWFFFLIMQVEPGLVLHTHNLSTQRLRQQEECEF
jgi:hypothetical protein